MLAWLFFHGFVTKKFILCFPCSSHFFNCFIFDSKSGQFYRSFTVTFSRNVLVITGNYSKCFRQKIWELFSCTFEFFGEDFFLYLLLFFVVFPELVTSLYDRVSETKKNVVWMKELRIKQHKFSRLRTRFLWQTGKPVPLQSRKTMIKG